MRYLLAALLCFASPAFAGVDPPWNNDSSGATYLIVDKTEGKIWRFGYDRVCPIEYLLPITHVLRQGGVWRTYCFTRTQIEFPSEPVEGAPAYHVWTPISDLYTGFTMIWTTSSSPGSPVQVTTNTFYGCVPIKWFGPRPRPAGFAGIPGYNPFVAMECDRNRIVSRGFESYSSQLTDD